MPMNKKLPLAALICALIFCLATAAYARGPVGDTVRNAGEIFWNVNAPNEGFVLTVSGNDVNLRAEYAAGEQPSINPADFAGEALEDGTYTFELQVVPRLDASVRETLANARAQGNGEAVSSELRRAGLIPEALVQSGSFTVEGGWIVTDQIEEAASKAASPELITKDQVILDDLIVDGSACIGQDCVNGESFGFDTLRLKENNLRIKFQDTSTSGSFPTVDWQLTANDSSNGGANKFSIDDIDNGRTPFTIEASAPSNSLYVDDDGRVGLGTATPVVELHVVNGDSPTLRLEQNGSSGFTAQTWDLAGNETNFFVRDVTNGSKLPFKIRPNAPTSSIFVEATGDIGLGTESPAADLHVFDSGTTLTEPQLELETNANFNFFRMTANGATTPSADMTYTNNSGNPAFRINIGGDGTQEFEIDSSGDLTVLGTVKASTLNTGGNAGTSICVDANGVLCTCGSCA